MAVTLQLALDLLDLERALRIADAAVPQGVDWVEAGTPLIKSEGLDAVRKLREMFPTHTIIADTKTLDAGRIEAEDELAGGIGLGFQMEIGTGLGE